MSDLAAEEKGPVGHPFHVRRKERRTGHPPDPAARVRTQRDEHVGG